MVALVVRYCLDVISLADSLFDTFVLPVNHVPNSNPVWPILEFDSQTASVQSIVHIADVRVADAFFDIPQR